MSLFYLIKIVLIVNIKGKGFQSVVELVEEEKKKTELVTIISCRSLQ